jgi:Calcineurin-like phosphoesterase
MHENPRLPVQIPALSPRGEGHQFVLYGDACSGIPGALHEQTFAAVNAVVRRLVPKPQFIIFAGDEIVGLTPEADQLRSQWRHWLDNEMGWLDRHCIPIWHATGNHTTYDEMSESVFREVLDLPRNGPGGQEGLSYWIRRGTLLVVFVHTLWTGLGGEGYVETQWLGDVLRDHADAKHKFVVGHHPVFPINGFSGPYQRHVGPEVAAAFWEALVKADVCAYLCSHILAFDAQVHRGVLQICTAGAGTAHRMPEGIEYLHCVQMALDAEGLRYQVLDVDGGVRETLSWPISHPRQDKVVPLLHGKNRAPCQFPRGDEQCIHLRFSGHAAATNVSGIQTLLSTRGAGGMPPLWIGMRGKEQRLTVIVNRELGRSPHYWNGPKVEPGQSFDIHLMLHAGMGPGGIMYKTADHLWSSMPSASPSGLERLGPWEEWFIGHGGGGRSDRPFQGVGLTAFVAY